MNFSDFKSQYENKTVIHYPNKVRENPLVSICIQTYQHENIINQCIDSILSQKVDFDYEILIGEDGSEDKTREICIDYANKYPEKIRLFLHHRMNNIRVNDLPTGRFNALYNFFSSKGEYIAICEGDDYWIDKHKLAKQIHICKKENVGVVMSDYYYLINSKLYGSDNPQIEKKDYYRVHIHNLSSSNYHFSHTSTYFFRRSHLKKLYRHEWLFKSWGLDTLLMPIFFENDKVFYLNEKMSVYRVNNSGISSDKQDGTGSIYRYKAIQYSSLKRLHPIYSKLIEYREKLAILRYFSRTLDTAFMIKSFYALIYLLRKGEFRIVKQEFFKLIRMVKNCIIS